MEIFRKIQTLREHLKLHRQAGQSIVIVPTMGNLHEGHIQLIDLAHQHGDIVVCSIFVNPLQFGLNEDWEQYPRTFESDCEKLTLVNCHYLFFPEDKEMYPNGLAEQTKVISPTMTDILCGASRPGHFEGVTTVVTKLFQIVQPDRAVFGKKDYQQLAIIQRMTEDLCMDIKIIGAPIARETDNLAYSSRNTYIKSCERPKVTQLYSSLNWVKDCIRRGERDYLQLELNACKQIENCGFRSDYISIREANTLNNAMHDDTHLVILGAMYTQNARLIDNVTINLNPDYASETYCIQK